MSKPLHAKSKALLLAATAIVCTPLSGALAEDPVPPTGDKHVSGMSIVGNDEAPKSLVIVPWKSSDLSDGLDVSKTTESGREPVDREVLSRELDYFELRTGLRD